jgi:hypothetical protein
MTHLKRQILASALLASYFVEGFAVEATFGQKFLHVARPSIARFPFTLLYLRMLRNFESRQAFEPCLLANKQTQENTGGVGCQPIIIALPTFVLIHECQRHSLASPFIKIPRQQKTDAAFNRCFSFNYFSINTDEILLANSCLLMHNICCYWL